MPDRPSLRRTSRTTSLRASLTRVVVAGVACALLVTAVGFGVERQRFGASDAATVQRLQREVRADFAHMTAALHASAGQLATHQQELEAAARDTAAIRRLFAAAAAALPTRDRQRFGLTSYDITGQPVAWSGRATEIPPARVNGPAALFVAPGALGPRLVYVLPVMDRSGRVARRVGTVVAERVLSTEVAPVGVPNAGTFELPTSPVPVSCRTRYEGAGAAHSPDSFVVSSPSGVPLIQARVLPATIAAARRAWSRGVLATGAIILAVTLLLCAGPMLDYCDRSCTAARYTRGILVLAALTIGARLIFWFALPNAWRGPPLVSGPGAGPLTVLVLRSPVDLVLTALALTALVLLAFNAVERRRIAIGLRHRLLSGGPIMLAGVALVYALASAVIIGLVLAYERLLRVLVAVTAPDPLHFSISTLNAAQLTSAVGLILLSVWLIWTGAILLRAVATTWRAVRHRGVRVLLGASWALPIAAAIAAGPLRHAPSGVPALVAVIGCGILAAVTGPAIRWHRRTSQAAGFGIVLLALLVPPMLMYPSVLSFADRAREQLIQTQFGPEAADLRDSLKQQLHRSLDQIDALHWLPDLVRAAGRTAAAGQSSTYSAFRVWSQTDLARARLTSAIELYGPDGGLVSRFALNLPEYATIVPPRRPQSCQWDLFEEVTPVGATERRVLHAGRALCEPNGHGGTRVAGAIVVQVMLDYNTLPFISSHNPYFELLRSGPRPAAPHAASRDIEFNVYGWSGSPLYTSGTAVWGLPPHVFARLVASRQPFWHQLTQNGRPWQVYFLSDRGGIYALGYPLVTPFGHFLNLAQLAVIVGGIYALLLLLRALAGLLVRRQPSTGRGLLREIRASFYRKLFLAFVAASVVPVVILAVATRTYIAAQLRAGIDSAAVRTVAVAQHVIDDFMTIQQRGVSTAPPVTDDVMVWISRVIDQDVNVFKGSSLLATSERDLFASGVLPTRTPPNVYRAIVLRHLPNFVGDETVGGFRYLVASAPVRAGGRDGVVTVPLTLRQQEIEQQINELDRRVLFAVLLFSLLGAAIGYYMAERIADPVNRLTRATRRIARGDLDAHIAASSSDELRRLVDAFNRMAADLKRQRRELERTQRVAAWADMARQVAHDIKNPLTPIQLSAEHLRRVHLDHQSPLGRVFDECLETILTQVRLLREIAGEFSSFASSPAPHPTSMAVADLLEEAVAPYRLGLADRIVFSIDVPDALPPITIDRLLMSRALANVIENAVSAMPGRGRLTVSAGLEADGRIAVRIEDDGVGMDEEAVRRAFEPYFSTRKTGTGLGMTIARRNVEANGGTIELESERGKGTRVTIRLPVGSDAIDAGPQSAAREDESAS